MKVEKVFVLVFLLKFVFNFLGFVEFFFEIIFFGGGGCFWVLKMKLYILGTNKYRPDSDINTGRAETTPRPPPEGPSASSREAFGLPR